MSKRKVQGRGDMSQGGVRSDTCRFGKCPVSGAEGAGKCRKEEGRGTRLLWAWLQSSFRLNQENQPGGEACPSRGDRGTAEGLCCHGGSAGRLSTGATPGEAPSGEFSQPGRRAHGWRGPDGFLVMATKVWERRTQSLHCPIFPLDIPFINHCLSSALLACPGCERRGSSLWICGEW